MGQLIHFYSAPGEWRDNINGPEVTGSKRAQATGAIGIRLANFEDFWRALDGMVVRNDRISRMVIETHGSPGAMYFGNDMVAVSSILGLRGRRYETLFDENAHIFLNGCNIAETECSTGTCGPAGNGRKFLFEMAKLFLSSGGGRVGASTSKGLGTPIANKVYHLWGTTVYVFINKGGTKIRLAAGAELPGPTGQWKVKLPRDEVVFYNFAGDRSVSWEDGRLIGGQSGKGTWSMEAEQLKIEWASGGREQWDLPLTTEEQSGKWTTRAGLVSDIEAEKIIDTGRIID
jgi:hypothetical protein